MQNLKSSTSSHRSSTSGNQKNRLPSPLLSEYEYLGRLVTVERPIVRKTNSLRENLVLPSNTNKYYHSTRAHHQEIYEEDSVSLDEDADGFNKPLGVIRINDRHFREIYRLPTPPPQIKRVFHRLRSPKPKIIERVFVHRPAPEIIENIIEVPPEKVRIINREKYLRKSKPVIRTKVVHLKQHHSHQSKNQQQQQQQQPTTLAYPPQQNPYPVSYTQSTIPPHIMLNSQQLFNPQIMPPTYHTYGPQQISLNFPYGCSQYYSQI